MVTIRNRLSGVTNRFTTSFTDSPVWATTKTPPSMASICGKMAAQPMESTNRLDSRTACRGVPPVSLQPSSRAASVPMAREVRVMFF
ncbi:hypothetical protein D3C86_1859190 [compost metagenome]